MPTGFRRGEIRLANLNPSKGAEPGKIRPCLILQSDYLNTAGHKSTCVLPLSSQITEDAAPLRYSLSARDLLRRNSDVLIDQMRTVDNRRLADAVLTTIAGEEMAVIEEYLKIVLGLGETARRG